MAFNQEVGRGFIPIALDTRGLNREFANVQGRFSAFMGNLGVQARSAWTSILSPTGIAAIGGGVLSAGSLGAFKGFNSAMTESLAIMNDVTSEQKAAMESQARSLSTVLTPSAEESAKAYFYLASAGYTVEQQIKNLPQVLAFAQAGTMDAAKATSYLADAQAALGLKVRDSEKNYQNLVMLTDQISMANNVSNGSIEDFSEALTNKAGGALKTYNKAASEGLGVLAAWADQGVKGRRAGENLEIFYRDLQKGAVSNKDEFKRLGIAVFDNAGKMRHTADIVEDLTRALMPMSDEQRTAAITALGITDTLSGLVKSMLGTAGKMREYESAIAGAGGTTQRVADNQLKSFSNQLAIVRNKVNLVAIDIGSALAPMALKGAHAVGYLAEKFTALNEMSGGNLSKILVGGGLAAIGTGLGYLLARSAVTAMVAPFKAGLMSVGHAAGNAFVLGFTVVAGAAEWITAFAGDLASTMASRMGTALASEAGIIGSNVATGMTSGIAAAITGVIGTGLIFTGLGTALGLGMQEQAGVLAAESLGAFVGSLLRIPIAGIHVIWAGFTGIAESIFRGIKGLDVFSKLTGLVNSSVNGLSDLISGTFNLIASSLEIGVVAATVSVVAGLGSMLGVIYTIGDAFKDALDSEGGEAMIASLTEIRSLLGGFASRLGVVAGYGAVASAGADAIGTAYAKAHSYATMFYSAVDNFIQTNKPAFTAWGESALQIVFNIREGLISTFTSIGDWISTKLGGAGANFTSFSGVVVGVINTVLSYGELLTANFGLTWELVQITAVGAFNIIKLTFEETFYSIRDTAMEVLGQVIEKIAYTIGYMSKFTPQNLALVTAGVLTMDGLKWSADLEGQSTALQAADTSGTKTKAQQEKEKEDRAKGLLWKTDAQIAGDQKNDAIGMLKRDQAKKLAEMEAAAATNQSKRDQLERRKANPEWQWQAGGPGGMMTSEGAANILGTLSGDKSGDADRKAGRITSGDAADILSTLTKPLTQKEETARSNRERAEALQKRRLIESGMTPEEANAKVASQGAKGAAAQFMGLEEYSKSIQTGLGGKDPQAQMVEQQKQTNQLLEQNIAATKGPGVRDASDAGKIGMVAQ